MHPLLNAFLSQTAEGGGGPAGLLANPLLMFAALAAVMYFIVLRPQSRERKKVDAFRQNMKKGDRVWTQGGIVGTVTQVEDQAVLIDIGAGKVRVLKTFVGGEWQEKPVVAIEPVKEAKK